MSCMMPEQHTGSSAADDQWSTPEEACVDEAEPSSQDNASNSGYVHRHGTREYMQAEVMPYVQQALEALASQIQQERLKLAAGVDREEGKYLPHGWRPFCPHRWMAEYLIAHKPKAAHTAEQGS